MNALPATAQNRDGFMSRPILAIVFGAFILCAETCLHFESIAGAVWLDVPWHDWIAGGWLIAAGLLAQKRGSAGQFLAAPWAFMLSLLVGAFFGHLAEWWTGTADAPADWLSETALLSILTGLMVVAACAVIGTLRNRVSS